MGTMMAKQNITGWWMVACLFLAYAFSWLDRLIITMLVTPIKQDLHLSDLQMGAMLNLSFALGFSIFCVPMGWAADRFDRRKVLVLGISVWSAATLGAGFAHSFPQLLICRALVGIGEASLLPAAYSLIADTFPPQRVTFATSVFQTASKFGSAVTFAVGALVITLAKHLEQTTMAVSLGAGYWQITLALVGLPGLVVALSMLTFSEPRRRESEKTAPPRKGELRAFLAANARLSTAVVLAATLIVMVAYSYLSWMPTYMERRFSWGPERYGPALGALNVFGAIAVVFSGRIVDWLFVGGMRDAHLRFTSYSIIFLIPVVFLAFYFNNPYFFLLSYAVSQIVTIPFVVFCATIVALVAPATIRAQLIGLLMMIYTAFGHGVGASLVGVISDKIFRNEAMLGMSLAIVIITSLILAAIVLRLALPELRRAVATRGDPNSPDSHS
ncbi:MFS transporter [Novosphingobium album (ex Liu et al. 2023)]|uniref:MFS transporter n=1 Tax=Novosphingobium album (ex Liu et al. 2023) TaxID=3031130 RepID=A0ABT5WRT4_9SPHN|nr:MFS transporter [Novosphingobium album (ex Liu et al. 2023)]MDE8652759.1 MFS transporter [Novosphingobium album (ex Liu et al. 2023)]